MGKRGRLPDYDRVMQLRITNSQDQFLDEVAELHGTTKSEVLRRFIDRAFTEALVQETGDASSSGSQAPA